MRFRIPPRLPLAALLIAAAPGALAAGPSPAVHHPDPVVRCEGAIQHPLELTARALDPVRRGAEVRVRVTTSARRDLARGEVRLISTGGATGMSPARATLGRLAAGRSAANEFTVRLPDREGRVLLEFRVTGEGPSGPVHRGATLNLLPDGPADPGRVVATSGGGAVTEYRARRIER